MAVFGPSPSWPAKAMAAATTITKTVSQRYSALRKAAAPSCTAREISCIFSVPASRFMIVPYLNHAKASATTLAPAAT